jgi:mono/diheme cytochrome c family protein
MSGMKWIAAVVSVSVLSGGCGGDGGGERGAVSAAPAVASADGLTAFELEHGIGPVTQPVELGAADEELAEAGEELFELKCMACHRLSERYIGPALGDVLERRSPAYVMNMMLNPAGMVEQHPAAKALLAEYLAPMPNQDLSVEDARALLEYLRHEASEID